MWAQVDGRRWFDWDEPIFQSVLKEKSLSKNLHYGGAQYGQTN